MMKRNLNEQQNQRNRAMKLGTAKTPTINEMQKLSDLMEFLNLITSKAGVKKAVAEILEKQKETEVLIVENNKVLAEAKAEVKKAEKAIAQKLKITEESAEIESAAEVALANARQAEEDLDQKIKKFEAAKKQQDKDIADSKKLVEKELDNAEKTLDKAEKLEKAAQEKLDEYNSKLAELKKIAG